MTDSSSHKKSRFLKIYTALFVVIFYSVFVVFDYTGKSFAWGRDSFTVEYPARLMLREWIVSFFKDPASVSMFHFSIGQGLDIASFLNTWYLDPINILMIFWPVSDSEIPFTAICILYLYLTGLSFFVYSTYVHKVGRECVIGSLIYCFSGLALYYAPRHPCFLAPMIYMPCIFLAIEKMIRRSKKYIFPFIFIIFLSLVSSYYYFYINTILMTLYIVIRLMINRKIEFRKKIMDLGIIGAGYILGIGLSSVFFLPAMYFYFHSNRMAGTAVHMKDYLLYEWPYYIREFVYIVIPYINDYRYWLILGIAPICLIGFFKLCLYKKSFELKAVVFSGLLFIMIPVFGLGFAAFSSINSRFSYYLIFGFALTFVAVYDSLYRFDIKIQCIIFLYGVLYFVACFFSKSIEKEKGFVGAALLALTMAAFCEAQNKYINIKIRQGILDTVILLTISFSGYALFSQSFIGYVNEFNDRGEVYRKMFDSTMESAFSIEDDSFFRIAENKTDTFHLNSAISAGKFHGVNGITMMHNVIDKNMAEFNILLGNNDYYDRTMIYGLDNRKILETLADVNYYIMPKQSGGIASIYNYDKSDQNNDIFSRKSEYNYHLGYLYSDVISRSEFERLDIMRRQEILLQAAVVDDSMVSQYPSFDDPVYWGKQVDYNAYNLDGQEISFNPGYTVSTWGEVVYLDFHLDEEADVYIQISRPSEGNSSYTAMVNGLEKNIYFEEESSMYFAGQNLYFVYMGELDAGDYRMAIRCDNFVNNPVISTENLQIYMEPVHVTNMHIQQMVKQQLQNVEMDSDYIRADIKTEKDALLFLSIPYTSRGWAAQVDGEQTDIMCTNIMYMGIPVEAGEHIVELTYTTPLLHVGFIISTISFLVVTILFAAYRFIRKYRVDNDRQF